MVREVVSDFCPELPSKRGMTVTMLLGARCYCEEVQK